MGAAKGCLGAAAAAGLAVAVLTGTLAPQAHAFFPPTVCTPPTHCLPPAAPPRTVVPPAPPRTVVPPAPPPIVVPPGPPPGSTPPPGGKTPEPPKAVPEPASLVSGLTASVLLTVFAAWRRRAGGAGTTR